jgi:hypothetical protein
MTDRAVCDLLATRDGDTIGRVDEPLHTVLRDGGDCTFGGIDIELAKLK